MTDDPKSVPLNDSLSTVRAIAAIAADARFVGFSFRENEGKEFPQKLPEGRTRAGVGADSPPTEFYTPGEIFSGVTPPRGSLYWGLAMHRPIEQKGYRLICLDLDTKYSSATPDIRMRRLIQNAKRDGLLYERSFSRKGAHIWLMTKADPSLPKKIVFGDRQEIEIFGNHPASPSVSVLLAGIELSGSLKVVPDLRAFLEEADIDPDFIPEDPRDAPESPAALEKLPAAEVREMLSYLTSDLHHDDWVRICMAAKTAGGRYDDIREWSASSPERFDQKVFDAKWPTWRDKPGGVGIGTLRRIARSAGWEPSGGAGDASDDWDSLPAAAGASKGSKSAEGGSKPRRPALVPLVLGEELAIMPTLIRGILPLDSLGMLWAPPGAYKSFLALDWALSVATGRQWFDHPVQKGTVWYLTGEGHAGIPTRIKAWRRAKGLAGPIENFFITERALLLDSEDGPSSPALTDLLRSISAGNVPSLIVVDTLARSMTGDENSAKDAGRFIAALGRLSAAVREAGGSVCILLVHHAKKDASVYRGSSALRGAVDFECVMEKDPEGFTSTLSFEKTKDGVNPAPIKFRAETEVLGEGIDNHGILTVISSLTLWAAPPERELSEIDKKVARIAPVVVQILTEFPDGLSTAALKSQIRLHDPAGIRDADAPGLLDTLAQRGDLLKIDGPRGSNLWKLPA